MPISREDLDQDRWRQIKKGPQRLVLCRLVIDLMRTVHGCLRAGWRALWRAPGNFLHRLMRGDW